MSVVEWYWPGERNAWGMAGWWTPDEGDDTQPESGIVTLTGANGDNSRLTFDDDDGNVLWEIGTETLVAPVGFDPGDSVGWAIGYDGTTARLVVRTGGAVTSSEATSGPGTTELNWLSIIVGEASGGFGSNDFGDGNFGGGDPTLGPDGVFEFMVGERMLTVAEATALLGASSAFGGLPYEAWPIWHASGDHDAVPLGSSMSAGLRYQATEEDGEERVTDTHGLTKGLGVLSALVTPRSTFAVQLSGRTLDACAFLASTVAEDDLADHHAQFAAACDQELRLR